MLINIKVLLVVMLETKFRKVPVF